MRVTRVLKNAGRATAVGLAMTAGMLALSAGPAAATQPLLGPVGLADWYHNGGPLADFAQLDLTREQIEAIRDLIQAATPAVKRINKQIRENDAALAAITPDDPNYAQVVASVTQANGALQAQLQALEAQVYAQAYAVLDAVQQQQMTLMQRARHQPL